MVSNLKQPWYNLLHYEIASNYFSELCKVVDQEYVNYNVFPPKEYVFNAFNQCNFEELKVVIIGQDPYHGIGQANGLAFSVNENIKLPPSLKNIFKELNNDLGVKIPACGNLERWAKQGVLLLNTTLTVRAATPGSHQKLGWGSFTDAVIQKISDQKEHVVFLLWGAFAHKKEVFLNAQKHLILKSAHPSPLSAYRGFLGNKHFSQTNAFLKKHGYSEIDW